MLASITVVLKISVGFLLFLPSPQIEYSTVTAFSAIKNFSELFEQLKRDTLPHFCHDGVFKIIVDIFFPKGRPILKFYTNVW